MGLCWWTVRKRKEEGREVGRCIFSSDSIAEASLTDVHKGKKEVAVVGSLHGNGVARHLREKHGFVLVDRSKRGEGGREGERGRTLMLLFLSLV